MKNRSRLPLYLLTGLVALWLVAPTLVVIPLSFTEQRSLAFPPTGFSLRWYENFFTSAGWVGGLLNSLQIALVVALVSTILGTAAAYALSKTAGFRALAARNLLLVPMLVPNVIFAVGLYALFLQVNLVGTFLGFLLAHTALALPFVVINVAASLASYDPQLEKAAWICGASKLGSFFTVTLPSIKSGVLSGFLFAFITSFDEVIVSLFISNPFLQTLPVRMFSSLQREVDPTIAAAATVIMAITTIAAALGISASSRKKNNA